MIAARRALAFARAPGLAPTSGSRAQQALAVLLALVVVGGAVVVVLTHPLMVDLEIPLRAADRWAQGGQPYLASAFADGTGPYDFPFFYPPPVLPLLVPLLALPRPVLDVAWAAALVGAAVLLLRRLGVPWWAVPIALCWVPFSEGLVGGNAQVLLVAAFVAVFFERPAGAWQALPRDPAGDGAPRTIVDGLLAAVTPALKATQPHGWVALLRRRPAGALAGLAVVGAVALATLPLTGLDAWSAWLAQLGRGADPSWALRSTSLAQLLPGPWPLALTAISVVLVLRVPAGRLGAGSGLLLVLGVPAPRNYGMLFLLPALMQIRREVALLAALLIAFGVAPTVWAGAILVAAAFVLEGRHGQPGSAAGAARTAR